MTNGLHITLAPGKNIAVGRAAWAAWVVDGGQRWPFATKHRRNATAALHSAGCAVLSGPWACGQYQWDRNAQCLTVPPLAQRAPPQHNLTWPPALRKGGQGRRSPSPPLRTLTRKRPVNWAPCQRLFGVRSSLPIGAGSPRQRVGRSREERSRCIWSTCWRMHGDRAPRRAHRRTHDSGMARRIEGAVAI